jgi:hypothetical protein
MEASVETAQVIPAEQVIAACRMNRWPSTTLRLWLSQRVVAVPGSARIADMA